MLEWVERGPAPLGCSGQETPFAQLLDYQVSRFFGTVPERLDADFRLLGCLIR